MANKKIRVGILAGGRSNERAVSLKSAEQVARSLSKEKYETRTTEIPAGSMAAAIDQLREIDVAFIAMHGTYAEDGRVQGLLDMLDIPYTGSGVLASAIGMNKVKTREILTPRGVRSPRFSELHRNPADGMEAVFDRVYGEIGFPCVVKPNESGSSVGVSIVRNRDELLPAIAKAFEEDDPILAEQYIRGREVTCGVLGNTNQTELQVLPIVEIVSNASFFDYHAKYESAETQEICPAPLAPELMARVQEMARLAHEALECDGLTRSDLIIAEDDTAYFLEINTIPGLTEASLCPKEARAAGISFPVFLDMQLDLALQKRTLRTPRIDA